MALQSPRHDHKPKMASISAESEFDRNKTRPARQTRHITILITCIFGRQRKLKTDKIKLLVTQNKYFLLQDVSSIGLDFNHVR